MAFFQSGRTVMRRPKRFGFALHHERVHIRHADVERDLDRFLDLVLVSANIDFEDVLVLPGEHGRLLGDDGAQQNRVGVEFLGHYAVSLRPRASFKFSPPQSDSTLRTASSVMTTWCALMRSTTFRQDAGNRLDRIDVARRPDEGRLRARR